MPVKTKETELAEHSWLREAIPDHSHLFAQGGRVDKLAWLHQVEMSRSGLRVVGIIKPDLSLKDKLELLRQLTDSYHKIVAILEEERVALWKMPELDLTGKAFGCNHPGCDCTPREFFDIEARIDIQLHYRG